MVRYKKKPSLFRSPEVDYFAPIQKVLDKQRTSQLLLEDSKSKSDLNNNVTNHIDFNYDTDTDDKSELMIRFCKSFQTAIESAFPYQSYNVAGVTTATATINKRYKVPNPDSDDYLESLQKRF